jgi:hypothetical protein
MTPDDFRRVALSMPEAIEGSHMENADFRVGGKIFATLWDDDEHGMVKLTPEQQDEYVAAHPDVFAPVKGAWGRQGCTRVRLDRAEEAVLAGAMRLAWRNRAPRALVKAHDDR